MISLAIRKINKNIIKEPLKTQIQILPQRAQKNTPHCKLCGFQT